MKTLQKLEEFAGYKFDHNKIRVVIKGYPADLSPEYSTENCVVMDAVDEDAAKELAKLLRTSGFTVSRVGKLGMIIG
jgi:hypothetical protein